MLEQINEIFFEEANELLESLEGYLLSLEQNPDNPEITAAQSFQGNAGVTVGADYVIRSFSLAVRYNIGYYAL